MRGQAHPLQTESPLIIHACHCRDCQQRRTGGAFVVKGWIEKKFVKVR